VHLHLQAQQCTLFHIPKYLHVRYTQKQPKTLGCSWAYTVYHTLFLRDNYVSVIKICVHHLCLLCQKTVRLHFLDQCAATMAAGRGSSFMSSEALRQLHFTVLSLQTNASIAYWVVLAGALNPY